MFNKLPKITHLTLTITLFLASALLFSGCSGNPDCCQETNAVYLPNQTLTVALGHGLEYLGVDPYGPGRENTALETVIFEPLALETTNGGFEPALATAWEADPSGTVWTFHLRQGVKFHDGSPFKADAVLAAFQHYQTDPGLSRRLNIAQLEAPDDHTVVFTLKRPFAPFLSVVGSFQCVIPSPHAFDASGQLVQPIGTGPFQVKSYNRQEVLLTAFADHWRGKPKLEELKVVYIPDSVSMVLALESGQIDLIGADGYGIPQNEIKRLSQNEQLKVSVSTETGSLEWIGFNLYRGPLQDPRVRKAVNYAIDRQAIVQHLLEGYGVAAVGPLGFDDSIPWTDTSIKGYPHNLQQAKELLQEAGWQDNGSGLRRKDGQDLVLSFYFPGQRTWKPVAETIQNQLAQAGIKVDLQPRDASVISDQINKGDFDLVALGSIGKSIPDPYYYIQTYFTGNGQETMIKDHPFLDQASKDLVSTLDRDKREAIYHSIQHEIMGVVPGAFLYHPSRVTVMKSDVQGWEFTGTMDPLRFAHKLYRQ